MITKYKMTQYNQIIWPLQSIIFKQSEAKVPLERIELLKMSLCLWKSSPNRSKVLKTECVSWAPVVVNDRIITIVHASCTMYDVSCTKDVNSLL